CSSSGLSAAPKTRSPASTCRCRPSRMRPSPARS
ncbi:MAG: hypothetical protein AVDCRST_MAG28-889, partial [uncultured Rubrobacteraceae bacterium]